MQSVMNVATNNNPNKVLSRLIHRDDGEYFKNVPQTELDLFAPKIELHISMCQHPDCKMRRQALGL